MNKKLRGFKCFWRSVVSQACTENLIYFKATRFLSILISLYLLLSSGESVFSQANTGANDTKANTMTTGGSLTVWAVPAEQKVRPDDAAETNNLVWSKEKKKITIAGAGNEHVPFQVVITVPVPPGRKPKAPDGFFIKASNLTSKQGKVLRQAQVSFYLEHYIMLYGKSSAIGATGYWPDALVPIKEPFSMVAQYDVVHNC